MKVELDRFQLVYYIKGSVCSAHGCAEIWHRVIQEFIPKLRNEEIDFLWWICYRDFWHNYLTSCTNHVDFGAESYLQGLAALNRNNRYFVFIDYKGEKESHLCYKFQGKFHKIGDRYSLFIAGEYITDAKLLELHEDEPNMQDKFVKDWQDIALYEKTPKELLNTRNGFL